MDIFRRFHNLLGFIAKRHEYKDYITRDDILFCPCNINFLLTEHERRNGEYWPEIVAVPTEPSEIHTKTIEAQYSSLRLELARLVSSLFHGTRAMFVFFFCQNALPVT